MTREEMIRKVLEELASQLLVHPQYGVVCGTCRHHNDIDRFNHADGCLTKMAIDILAKPVIEVGDNVVCEIPEESVRIEGEVLSVVDTALVYNPLNNNYAPVPTKYITSVRKGAKP